MRRNLANEKLRSVWRTKLTVACVAKTGDDECVFIESLVNRSSDYVQGHSRFFEIGNTFGCGKYARNGERLRCAASGKNFATMLE